MQRRDHYDLAIIGSGSGNSVITEEMADWRIAVIDSGIFGGTCLNVGCIPTKMFFYPADLAAAISDAGRLGVDATLDRVRWRDLRDRVFGRIDPISVAGRQYRERGPGTAFYPARAEFVGPHELLVATGERISADQIVIATGSRATVPNVVRAAGVPFHTSDTIMRIDAPPRRLVILGGGYIAAEFAHIFSAFGARVTLITRGDGLLRHLDGELSRRFTELAGERWRLHLGATAAAVAGTAEGVRLTLSDGARVDADLLLVATGRAPNADRIGADAAGIARAPDGRVAVDRYQRTSADGVWALGDVCSPAMLKHVANHEARVVAHNLVHPDALVAADHRHLPAAVFTHPQLASVGLTERTAREQGRDCAVAVQQYRDTAYGWAMEDTTSLCKLLADRDTGQLLGAHLMGPQASVLIQPLVQAMALGLPVAGLARAQYWIHPALTEVVENALLKLESALASGI
ncbi:MAG: mycothione reductase [Actinomycetia bacterium]|nr:mycothione reductase [Actinomycetes bacterium]